MSSFLLLVKYCETQVIIHGKASYWTMSFFLKGIMFPKYVIAALFVNRFLFCPVQATLASIRQCNGTTYSIPNRVLTGHAFLKKPSPSIDDCVVLCIKHDPYCKSINYYRKERVCELNDKTTGSNPDDMADFEWAIYMTNGVRLFPCYDFDFECGQKTDVCLLKKDHNKCKGKIEQVVVKIPLPISVVGFPKRF